MQIIRSMDKAHSTILMDQSMKVKENYSCAYSDITIQQESSRGPTL